ncbi:hypothetical protein Poli38472_001637 [Pythium oligandrum]|uniref:Pentatricopeptide repeat-containing protein n=1 Tax=Pythium oligandrum TaxID=41045 RepID=A0A8K1FNK1_PYTOL|nr:hypothetical protein Poli38472_001637 [Pythium oligandrum]|eukprot:TMW69481.1 hypothetical protein Poli38472_001637 [Pythium oligandrum]
MTRQQDDTPLWRWDEEEATQELVRALQSGTKAETRMFLRIVLKWMKIGLKKDGNKDQVSIEKAFALVDWMVRVSTEGDTRLNIEKQDGLQPNQALHSILTASRRTGSAFESQRAFDLMLAYGFTPDVVAYTTLIDVLARSVDTHGALQVYNSMRDSKNPQPNVVTFSTVIHAIGFTTLVDPSRCLTLLQQASVTEDEERAMDDALFLDA